MNLHGLVIGIATFLIIGLFHPIVIKAEYYIGKKLWPVFLIMGLFFVLFSIPISNVILSSIIGVIGFSSLWSIQELIEQESRVKKGWFPANPKKQKQTKKRQGKSISDGFIELE